MATLARSGRISTADVQQEIQRLSGDSPAASAGPVDHAAVLAGFMSPGAIGELDLFDQLQLAAVIQVCRECRSLSDAGRRLFSVSRSTRSSINDADRLRKFLSRFGLTFQELTR
jgi:transcriptional regulatory protein RtcR